MIVNRNFLGILWEYLDTKYKCSSREPSNIYLDVEQKGTSKALTITHTEDIPLLLSILHTATGVILYQENAIGTKELDDPFKQAYRVAFNQKGNVLSYYVVDNKDCILFELPNNAVDPFMSTYKLPVNVILERYHIHIG